jgi:protease I
MAKKIVMIIAFRDFRDEEYFIPKEILELSGFKVITASSSSGMAIGTNGGEVEINIELEDIKIEDFDAILFVGGPGALKYLNNETSYKIARETLEKNKILGAICISPVILAKAGVLNGRKATVWNSLIDKSAVKILKEAGAIFQNTPVVVDGKIITSSGPEAARDFAEAVISALSSCR